MVERDSHYWEGRSFYDIIRLRPLTPRFSSNRANSFAFKAGAAGPGHGLGGMGIAHDLVQQYLCRSAGWNVSLFGYTLDLTFEKVDDEVPRIDPVTSRTVIVDCLATLNPGSPFRRIFGDEMAIEVHDKHAVSLAKKQSFQNIGLTALEFHILKEWHVKNEDVITSSEICRLQSRIHGLLGRSVSYVSLLACSTHLASALPTMSLPRTPSRKKVV